MAQTNASPLPDIDVTDLLKVICGFRTETFRYEREIALLTFNTWILFPDRKDVLNQGRVIAAASVIRKLQRGSVAGTNKKKRKGWIDQIGSNVMQFETVAELLLDSPHLGDFRGEQESTWGPVDTSSIIAFFLRCPLELHPSLNKAIFFIDELGFGKDSKASPATLKKSWVQYAISSPFVFAGEYLDTDLPLIMPDEENAIAAATKFSKNKKTILRYFGCAKYFQEKLLERLDPSSLRRFSFIKFPAQLKSYRAKIEPLESDQLEIVRRYRAPRDLPDLEPEAAKNSAPSRLEIDEPSRQVR